MNNAILNYPNKFAGKVLKVAIGQVRKPKMISFSLFLSKKPTFAKSFLR